MATLTVLLDRHSAPRTRFCVGFNETLAGFDPSRSLESLGVDLVERERWEMER